LKNLSGGPSIADLAMKRCDIHSTPIGSIFCVKSTSKSQLSAGETGIAKRTKSGKTRYQTTQRYALEYP
jgi:hypothetical protein